MPTTSRTALATLRALLSESHDTESLATLAHVVTHTVEQLRQHAGVVRFLSPPSQDQLVAAGATFDLVADLSLLRGLVAERVRFSLSDRPLMCVPVESGAAFGVATAPGPGHYRLQFEALGPGDVVVQRGPPASLQVVDQRPVILVDAALVFVDSALPDTLRRLVQHGLHVAWVDFSDRPRTDQVRRDLQRRLFPQGALLSHVREGLGPSLQSASLHTLFLRTAVRRMRASGVAIVAVVSDNLDAFCACPDEALALITPAALHAHLQDPTWLVAQDARAEALHTARAAAGELRHRLDETTRTRVTPHNRCHVELSNRAARHAVLSAIDAAQTRIRLQVYIVEDGRFMDRLGAHLIAAARRGVDVRLLVDALYSKDHALGMRNPILTSLRDQPGIAVRATDPVPLSSAFELRALKRRDHRKLLLIDHDQAFVSGRNAGDAYYFGFDEVAITDYTPFERVPWLDAHVTVAGPLVSQIAACFEQAWAHSGGSPAPPGPPQAPAGTAAARLVVHAGASDANGMNAYEALLDAARSHVFILNDFPIVSVLVSAVRRAIGRGVRVCLLTGNALPRRGDGTFLPGPLYRELFEHMTKGRLEPLVRRGLELYEYATPMALPEIVCAGDVVRPYVHAKLMTVDGLALSVGSANLDGTASFWEREANVIIEDPATVGPVEAWITTALARSWRVDPDSPYWRREAGLRDLVARLWPESLYS